MTNHSKQILYITYQYPPVGGSGVQRGLKFTKYLPDEGWKPIVLTAAPFWVNQPKDSSLAKEIKPDQKVYRTFCLDATWLFKVFWGLRMPEVVFWLIYHIFIPDAQVLWLPFAKAKIKRIMRKHHPQLAFISGPPFSPMLLGKWIKDRYHIPYILDFRDDWSLGQSRLDNHPPPSFSRIEALMERNAIHDASLVTVVIDSYISDFLRLYGCESIEKFTWIPNGYDDDDFPSFPSSSSNDLKKLRIVYTGQFYGRRHPGIIWQALANLINNKEIDANRIEFHIYGSNHEAYVFKGFEQNNAIRNVVKLHGYIPHGEVYQKMLQSDMLLLFTGAGPRSETELTGKFFEYLRMGKPILAVIHPHGASAEVLREAQSGYVANHEDITQIEQTIMHVFRLWEKGELQVNPNWDYIRQFERRKLTEKLARCFDLVAEINT